MRYGSVHYFTRAEHDEYGKDGWKPDSMPHGDPLQGLATAHDCLEHFPGDDGNVPGELRALGAMLYVRGEGGYWYQYGNMRGEVEVGQNLAADLPDIFQHVTGEGFALGDPGRTARIDPDESEAEGWISEALASFRSDWRESNGYPGAEPFGRDWPRIIRGYMRQGYRRAVRRYTPAHRRGANAPELSAMFHEIETAADVALRDEFQRLRVRVSIAGARVDVSRSYGEALYLPDREDWE